MSALYKTGTVAWIQIAEDSEWILAYARDYTWVYLLAGTTRLGNGSISPLTAPSDIQIVHLPEHAEPEDKDDLYVEPEPLKEGDWVLVWAKVEDEQYINTESNVLLSVVDIDDAPGNVWARYDAIVRPSAGQVPPWVKPAPLTIDPSDEDGQVAELAHAIADHCGVSVTFADLAKALAERSAAEGGAS